MASTQVPSPSEDLPPREQLELFSQTGHGARAAPPAPASPDMAKKSKPSKKAGSSGGGGGVPAAPGGAGGATPGENDASLETEARR
jgi:hypothetical protein